MFRTIGPDTGIMEEREGDPLESSEQQSTESDIRQSQEAVSRLYDFSTHYFEHHGVEFASRKTEDVRQQMQETLALLDRLQGSLPKVQYWYLRGKALNVLPDHSPEAEQCLSKAIKNDPSLVDAWNALGESYWKAGNVQQAYDCFVGSLTYAKSKESLRNLSMVMRQMGKDPTERESKVKESLEKAKEAVSLDVKDGTSWMILGNAYLSLFFMSNQDPKLLKQCVSAYNQAEKDPVTANNPDLHFNKATLCQYEEDYSGVLRELSLASALDPGWDVPMETMQSTRQFLHSMAQSIASKGKLKAKRLSILISSLSSPEKYLGVYASGKSLAQLGSLIEGVNEEKVVVLAVTATVPTKDKVPHACVLVDGAGESIGVTVYNLARNVHFVIGDVLTIPNPLVRHTIVQDEGETVDFLSIHVTNPVQLLLNGHKLSADKLAPPTVSITAFS